MLLPDVNVLIYAHREDMPEHPRYAAWLKARVESPEPFALSELALSGFLRIVTNPKIFVDPTPLDRALRFVELLTSRRNAVSLRPGPQHWSIFRELCLQSQARAGLIADAYHAALAIEHGCELVSRDSDFARFSGLRWSHPLRRT